MRESLAALARFADRLSPLVPARTTIDWAQTVSAVWRSDALGGALVPVASTVTTALTDLVAIDRQRDALVANLRQFLAGFPANNVLLTGSRGAGKSSLIQALITEFHPDGLRLVQLGKTELVRLPQVFEQVAAEPYRFLVFCDDLSFDGDDDGYKLLKSALEGSVERRASNCLICATSNRRHLLPERRSDNLGTRIEDGELHEAEAVEEKISLSDRFGLWLTFYPMKQLDYLTTVRHWLRRLLADYDALELLPDDLGDDRSQVLVESLAWARARGNRSGRTAHYFARDWVGRRLLEADADTCAT
ncbi:MAG: ATP-binding protein [Pseudomonadota bacterium]